MHRHAQARDRFHTDVLMELHRTVRQRGWLTTDLVRAALIMQEEAGEVSAGALQCTRSYSTSSDLDDLYHELVQLASVTIQMAANVRATMAERDTRPAKVDGLTASTLGQVLDAPTATTATAAPNRIVRAVDRFFRKVTPKS